MFNYLPRLLPFLMGIHNLIRRLWRTLLTALGITLGVAVVLAIDITNNSTMASIEATFQRAVGKAELLVVPQGDETTMPVELTTWVQDTPGVQVAAPVARMQTARPGDSLPFQAQLSASGVMLGTTFEIQGIDPELDPQVRLYYLAGGRFPEPERYEILLPQNLANDLGVEIGEDFSFITPYGIEKLEVVGLLKDEGVAVINNGEVGFVPLGTVQEIFELGDSIHEMSVQVLPEIGSSPGRLESLKEDLADRLKGEARPIYPAARGDLVPRMLNAYQMGLTFFSIIAVFVGAFLIYNTFSMTVVERTQEIGMLRAIGMSRAQVLGLVLSEACILASFGVLLGIAAGILLARGLLILLGGFLAAKTDLLSVTSASILKSSAVGLFATLLAAVIPAYQAANTSPLEALRVHSRTARRVRPLVWISGLELFFVGWAGLYWIEWRAGVLMTAGGTSFVLLLLGAVLTLPLLVDGLERSTRLIARLLYGNEGTLGSANVRRSVLRTTLTVACLMIALVMIIGIGSLSDTFKIDVQHWVDSALGGDIYLLSSDTLPLSFGNQLQDIPGVAAVSPARYLPVRVAPDLAARSEDGREKLLFSAIDPAAYRQVGDMVFTSGQGDAAANWAALSAGRALFISSVVADAYGLQQGDELTLITRRGEQAFTVAAIVTDFTGQGYIVTGTYDELKRWYGESGAEHFSIAVAPGASPQDVSASIRERFGSRYQFNLQNADTIQSSVLGMLDQSFRLFDVLSLIGVVIGALGVVNTLTMNVLERRREIGGLRSLGMTRRQVQRMVLAEALALGLMGCIYGLPLGYAISNVFVFAMTALSSYEVTYVFSLRPYLLSLGIAIAISQVAAIGAARRAAQTNIVEAIQHE